MPANRMPGSSARRPAAEQPALAPVPRPRAVDIALGVGAVLCLVQLAFLVVEGFAGSGDPASTRALLALPSELGADLSDPGVAAADSLAGAARSALPAALLLQMASLAACAVLGALSSLTGTGPLRASATSAAIAMLSVAVFTSCCLAIASGHGSLTLAAVPYTLGYLLPRVFAPAVLMGACSVALSAAAEK